MMGDKKKVDICQGGNCKVFDNEKFTILPWQRRYDKMETGCKHANAYSPHYLT